MRLRFLPAARAEFLQAIAYYEQQVPGLGARLLRETRRTLRRLSSQPRSAPVLRQDFRRMALAEFPFALIYRVTDEEVRISAFAHRRRRPDYWIRRPQR